MTIVRLCWICSRAPAPARTSILAAEQGISGRVFTSWIPLQRREDCLGSNRKGIGHPRCGVLVALCLAFGLLGSSAASAQVVPAGYQERIAIHAGGTASEAYLEFGQTRLLGATAFADIDIYRHYGIEGEARFLEFNQPKNIHAETYLGGPRARLNVGRFQVYAKGLIGLGVFHYTYGYGGDSDFVAAGGGGVDFHISPRVHLRLADAEYQYWPEFHYGPMSSFVLSAGLRIRVF